MMKTIILCHICANGFFDSNFSYIVIEKISIFHKIALNFTYPSKSHNSISIIRKRWQGHINNWFFYFNFFKFYFWFIHFWQLWALNPSCPSANCRAPLTFFFSSLLCPHLLQVPVSGALRSLHFIYCYFFLLPLWTFFVWMPIDGRSSLLTVACHLSPFLPMHGHQPLRIINIIKHSKQYL